MAGRCAAFAALCALVVLATAALPARDALQDTLQGVVRKDDARVYGPLGTFFDGDSFFNAMGVRVPTFFFDRVSDKKYVVKNAYRSKVYPKGFVYSYGKLIGANGVYFSRGVYRTLGDDKRIMPSWWFAKRGGGFYIKNQYINQLYPRGYWFKWGGLYGPKGLYHVFNVKANKSFFYAPGPRQIGPWHFEWVNGAYYLRVGSRKKIIPMLTGDPGYPPGAGTPKKPKLPKRQPAKRPPAKLPAEYQYVKGRLFGPYGVYRYKGVYRTFGDNNRILPASWFWEANGVFYVRQRNVWQIYPKGYKWVNGGLQGPEGVWLKRVTWSLTGRFYLVPSFKLLPAKYFRWFKGGHLIKNQFRWAIAAPKKSQPKRKVTLPAKIPKGYELVQGRLFGAYGVYRYKGVYRTFGDKNRILPASWIWEANGVFYVRQRNVWQIYPKGYKWVNGGLQGPEGVWFKRVKGKLEGRFYLVPKFKLLPANYFRWFKGGHLIKNQFRWAIAAPKKAQPKVTRPAKIPKGYQYVKGRLFGPYGVYRYKGVYRTFGDNNRILPASWFWEANGVFYVRQRNVRQIYPKGYKWVNGGLEGPEGVWLKRVTWSLTGRFYLVPSFKLLPAKYFRWFKGGHLVKNQFRWAIAAPKKPQSKPKKPPQKKPQQNQASPRRGSPGIFGKGNAGKSAPKPLDITKRRPGRKGPVVKILPYFGKRKRFEYIKGKVYGDYNVVWNFKKFWTLGDPKNVLPKNIFTVRKNRFFLKKGKFARLYPKGYTFDAKKGLVSKTRIYFQRLPGRTQGSFFFPGGAVVPYYYMYFKKGGFVMKERFAAFVLHG